MTALTIAAAAASCRSASVATPAANASVRAPVPVGVPGTYELAVCRGTPCIPRDTIGAYTLATLVLFDSVGAEQADLPTARFVSGRRATGCYVIRFRRRPADSYAGAWPRDYFRWTTVDGAVRFPLYRSPDAFYTVCARVTPEGLVGGGTSSGMGVADLRGPRDTITAVRTGPADRRACHVAG